MVGEDKFKAGLQAYRAGNFEEAGELLQEALEIDDQNHKAWNALGIVCSKIGNYEDADVCYENALTIAPETTIYEENRTKNSIKLRKQKFFDSNKKHKDKNRTNAFLPNIQQIRRPLWHYIFGLICTILIIMLVGIGGGTYLFKNSTQSNTENITQNIKPLPTIVESQPSPTNPINSDSCSDPAPSNEIDNTTSVTNPALIISKNLDSYNLTGGKIIGKNDGLFIEKDGMMYQLSEGNYSVYIVYYGDMLFSSNIGNISSDENIYLDKVTGENYDIFGKNKGHCTLQWYLGPIKFSSEEWYKLGIKLNDEGKYQEALDAFFWAWRLNFGIDLKPEYLYYKGIALMGLEKYQEAYDTFYSVEGFKSKNISLYGPSLYYQGVALNGLGKYGRAYDALLKLEKVDPGYAHKSYDFWYNVGVAANGCGKYNEAIIACSEAKRINPGANLTYGLCYNMGMAYNGLEKYDQAFDAFDKELKLYPNNSKAQEGRNFALSKK